MSHQTTAEQLLESLRAKGHRITAGRKAIVAALVRARAPLSSADVHRLLTKQGVAMDKVTVYRELTFLEKIGMTAPVQLQDRSRRYELAQLDHHHHVICLKCERVEDFQMDRDLEKQERAIEKQKDFKIVRHSLEFFGLCPDCR